METETLDKLYLEWSQFTRARTAREISMLHAVRLLNSMVEKGERHTDSSRKAVLDALSPTGKVSK
jgi:hypothetical protein